MFKNRPDGDLVKNESTLRYMIPYVMQKRNESSVYFNKKITLTAARQYLKESVSKNPEQPITLFEVLVAAFVKCLAQRPKLNRFVSGRRIYQRNKIQFAFAVKKKFDDDSPITSVKITFQSSDTIFDVRKRLNDAIHVGRGEELTHSEKEVGLLMKLPRFLLEGLIFAQKVLDYYNLLPAFMIEPDPLYASLFLANLGSIGIDGASHHLYEYGNIPLFCVIGKTKMEAVVGEDGKVSAAEILPLNFTFDERIVDGFYCSKTLDLLEEFMHNPKLLEE